MTTLLNNLLVINTASARVTGGSSIIAITVADGSMQPF